MAGDIAASRLAYGVPKALQRENRQKMNGAEKAEHFLDVDGRTAKGDGGHERHPEIAYEAVMACSLGPP